jgi:hypothetical protein
VSRREADAGSDADLANMDDQTSRNNKVTAVVLATIVAAFFFGIMLKYLLLR